MNENQPDKEQIATSTFSLTKTPVKPAALSKVSPLLTAPFIDRTTYKEWYQLSLDDPEAFWMEHGKCLHWFSPFEKVVTGDFKSFDVQWFRNGKLNACYNCVDRYLGTQSDQSAILWESDDPNLSETISYRQLHERVSCFANVLKKQGIKKGDRVCIYLPMIPEVIIAMLACARIGAVHSVVFAGFSANALEARLIDLQCKVLVTADETVRGGRVSPCKLHVDKALLNISSVKSVIVVKRTHRPIPWDATRDHWYHKLMQQVNAECPAEPMDANDPLFILYTSGSTGQPKGIVHNVGGYLVFVTMTFKYIFNYTKGNVFWCTADAGWITGHSYLTYGPLANGATIVLFEGVPSYPSYARYWEIIDKYQVNIFYTAPTAIRALRHEGDQWVKKKQRTSLNILGSVGEPISPSDWEWYHQVIGEGRCPIVDTWWQTETGGILMTALPGATPLKPGSAGWPFFGIEPEIVDEKGLALENNQSGRLVLKRPWPGLMQGIYNNQQRLRATYFNEVPGSYLTGDSAYRDEEGYFWIIGRNDDVIKISGHRIGTGEIESALLSNEEVSEAAATAIPDAIKGNVIYAFVVLKAFEMCSEALKEKLQKSVRTSIGPIAKIGQIQWARSLPKTRSGKIMRRILQKIATDNYDELGDTSTLSNPSIVEEIVQGRKSLAGLKAP
ncbi:MAG: acetate--CoA ligase [Legionella sp.]|nr:acetate--CoA ligase [Legionella sp.]